LPIVCQSDDGLCCGIFVEPNKFAKGYGEGRIFGSAERIYPELAFKPGNDYGKTQGVEPGIKEREVIGEGSETLVILAGDLLELVSDF
jgi:hypothetical protein